MTDLRRLEEVSLQAWPALDSYEYDGWLLRFADGYTKRANSVTPLDRGVLPLGTKIATCEARYRETGLRPIFRLPGRAELQDLDSALAQRGYTRLDETSVQGLPLVDALYVPSAGVEVLAGEEGMDVWLSHFHALNPARTAVNTHRDILRLVSANACPMLLLERDEVAACGLGVYQDGYLGLFDIVTAEAQSRRGYGRRLTQSLLAWGLDNGANYAYLQVMVDNKPALCLYDGLGFREQYRYWYRVAPDAA